MTVTVSVTVFHVTPESLDTSILYAVTVAPPVEVGALHESAIVAFPDGVAVRLVGAEATVAGVPEVAAEEPRPALVITVFWK